MKKYIVYLLAAIIWLASSAQTDPNRLFIRNDDGTTTSIMIDRVESLGFATIEGEVRAEVKVLEYSAEHEMLAISVIGTPDCKSWKYVILPESKLKVYDTDSKLAKYISAVSTNHFDRFLEDGAVLAPGLEPGSKYAIAVLGLDIYETPCEVSVDLFETPRAVAGSPAVEATFSNITSNSFDVTLTPNAECPQFVYVVYPVGQLETDYATYGPMFGVTSIEAYVKDFAAYVTYSETVTNTHDGLLPGTTYQVSVVPMDSDGNLASMQTFTVTTEGGVEGDAWVEIEQREFALQPIPNPDNILEIIYVPHQTFYMTPGEATMCFRAEMFTEEEYERLGHEAAEAKVKSEPAPDVPDDMWFRYNACRQTYRIDPGVTGYVLAAGKNFKGEWGAVNILRFTTPTEIEGQ